MFLIKNSMSFYEQVQLGWNNHNYEIKNQQNEFKLHERGNIIIILIYFLQLCLYFWVVKA